jgi:predicted DNA-binding transcriptional regulator
MNSPVSKLLAALMKELGNGVSEDAQDYPVPEGWSSVDDIRNELRMAHTRNASSRAYDLFRRGLLQRQAHQYKAKTGQCHKAYVYKPLPPYRSIREASESLFKHQADKVPQGWVRVVDYCLNISVSDVCLRTRIARAGIKPKYYKTPRGIIGLHHNAYYKKTDLDRVMRKR